MVPVRLCIATRSCYSRRGFTLQWFNFRLFQHIDRPARWSSMETSHCSSSGCGRGLESIVYIHSNTRFIYGPRAQGSSWMPDSFHNVPEYAYRPPRPFKRNGKLFELPNWGKTAFRLPRSRSHWQDMWTSKAPQSYTWAITSSRPRKGAIQRHRILGILKTWAERPQGQKLSIDNWVVSILFYILA